MSRRKRFMFWLHDGWPEWKPAWFIDAASWLGCKLFGHVPAADQCGKPEHDFCLWCMKATPGQAPRPVPTAAKRPGEAGSKSASKEDGIDV